MSFIVFLGYAITRHFHARSRALWRFTPIETHSGIPLYVCDAAAPQACGCAFRTQGADSELPNSRSSLPIVVITSLFQKLSLVTSRRRPKHLRLGFVYFFMVISAFPFSFDPVRLG